MLTRNYIAPDTFVGDLTRIRSDRNTTAGAWIFAPVCGPQVALKPTEAGQLSQCPEKEAEDTDK